MCSKNDSNLLQHSKLLMKTAEELQSLSCTCGFHVCPLLVNDLLFTYRVLSYGTAQM